MKSSIFRFTYLTPQANVKHVISKDGSYNPFFITSLPSTNLPTSNTIFMKRSVWRDSFGMCINGPYENDFFYRKKVEIDASALNQNYHCAQNAIRVKYAFNSDSDHIPKMYLEYVIGQYKRVMAGITQKKCREPDYYSDHTRQFVYSPCTYGLIDITTAQHNPIYWPYYFLYIKWNMPSDCTLMHEMNNRLKIVSKIREYYPRAIHLSIPEYISSSQSALVDNSSRWNLRLNYNIKCSVPSKQVKAFMIHVAQQFFYFSSVQWPPGSYATSAQLSDTAITARYGELFLVHIG